MTGAGIPTRWAFNRCHYDAARKTLYIFDELTRLRTSNEETAKLVQQRIESWESVTADSAEMNPAPTTALLASSAVRLSKGREV